VRKLLWAGLLLGTLLLLFLASMLLIDQRRVLPPFKVPVAREQPATASSWKIGVLGDSQKGLANLRNISREVLKQEVRLVLHSGDLVANNDDGHYFLAFEALRQGGMLAENHLWPIVAPGNHDLKGDEERFQRWCRALERSFTKNDVAIVVLNNAFGRPPPDPQHVDERIAAAGPHKAVVLLMHQPPLDLEGNPKPEYAAFLTWLEKSKVAYLLCGHAHGYIRKKLGETTVIINGVGGDYDKWQLDQKVYATILDVDGATISDRRIEIEPAHEVWENVEHLAIGHVGEAYRRKPVPCWLGTLLLVGGLAWGWIKVRRRPRGASASG
jgi:hypothetical protein